MLRDIGLIDEKFVDEASEADEKEKGKGSGDPAKLAAKRAAKKKRARVILAIAAVLAVMFVLWLFVPLGVHYPDVSRYRDSEYYEIISSISRAEYLRTNTIYKNNFEKYIGSYIGSIGIEKAKNEDEGYSATESGNYVETTDNQVRGVTEADKIKRSDRYIFHLTRDDNKSTLKAYTIEGENSRLAGDIEIGYGENYYIQDFEFYLSGDCRTATVILSCNRYDKPYRGMWYTFINSIDVSDPENMVCTKTYTIEGYYLSSRVTDGKLLVAVNNSKCAWYRSDNYDDPHAFLPEIYNGERTEILDTDDIEVFEQPASQYTVICRFDEDTLELEDKLALLACANVIYMTHDNMYVVNNCYDRERSSSTAEIIKVSVGGDKLECLGSACVDGTVLNQYSLDEYDGILRAVTTVGRFPDTSASLYCLDAVSLDTLSAVRNFAPKGESVRSARFDKNVAYVCTSVERMDPVFFFDLSDINNITYKDTGTIPGFSTSLVNFGEGYLLGIGRGENFGLKIEVYREGENSVEPVCAYTVDSAEYNTDYKSYLIDRENKCVGLAAMLYNGSGYYDAYLLLHFDGNDLKAMTVPIETLSDALWLVLDYARAVVIDDHLYVLGNDITVVPVEFE